MTILSDSKIHADFNYYNSTQPINGQKKAKKLWTGSKYTPIKRMMRNQASDGTNAPNCISEETILASRVVIDPILIMKNVRALANNGYVKDAYDLLLDRVNADPPVHDLRNRLVDFNMVCLIVYPPHHS